MDFKTAPERGATILVDVDLLRRTRAALSLISPGNPLVHELDRALEAPHITVDQMAGLLASRIGA